MNDTAPLEPVPPTPKKSAPRRRTMLLVGAAAAVGVTALGVTAAVAGSSGPAPTAASRTYAAQDAEGATPPTPGAEGGKGAPAAEGSTPCLLYTSPSPRDCRKKNKCHKARDCAYYLASLFD
ncbi:hypothetical protein AERO_12770, partial [Aeromicrobium fastidiosum]|uniref:hypothetical protein n=1 Tax=Aeromicrobium fastidiosum TaxID=52699 RepID=UPI0020233B03